MAFDDISVVPRAATIMRIALAAGRKKPVRKNTQDTPLVNTRKRERERLTTITQELVHQLIAIPKRFPDLDTLSEFYRELLATRMDLDGYRERLGRIQNTGRAIQRIRTAQRGRIEAAGSVAEVKHAMRQFIGRAGSAVERLDKDLAWLEEQRIWMRTLPVIKQRFTVCIAGFPNVGKTTLLKTLTGSIAAIENYAFTTKGLNLGYRRIKHQHVQFIDTPGTLDRTHRNPIELQAHLALQYAADVIIYVWDVTEPYPLTKQTQLRARMHDYGKPVLDYLAKRDILTEQEVSAFCTTHPCHTVEELLTAITALLSAPVPGVRRRV